MNLAHTDRRAPHRTDRTNDLARHFNRKAADDREQMIARLDEWLAELRKDEKELTA